MDLSVFSLDELKALKRGDLEAIELSKLKYLREQVAAKQEGREAQDTMSTMDVLSRQAERAATGVPRALAKVGNWVTEKLGGTPSDIDFYNKAYGLQTDAEKEGESRVAWEEKPVASFAGSVAGSLLDPTNLISGAGVASKVIKNSPIAKATLAGGVSGAIGGAVTPTYEQYGDSIVMQLLGGFAIGGTAGAAMGKLGQKLAGSSGLDAEAARSAQLADEFAKRDQLAQTAGRSFEAEDAGRMGPPFNSSTWSGVTDTVDPMSRNQDPAALLQRTPEPPPKMPTEQMDLPLGKADPAWSQKVLDRDITDPQMKLFDVQGFTTKDEYKGKLLDLGSKAGVLSPEDKIAQVDSLSKELKIPKQEVEKKAMLFQKFRRELSDVGVTKTPETWDEAIEAMEKVYTNGSLLRNC